MPSKVGGLDDSIWTQSEDLAGASAPSDQTALVEASFGEPKPQRRWTVALRILLALPHLLLLVVLQILACGVVLLGWFAALVIGRFPEGFNAFLRGVIRYATRVFAYVYLLLDAYPPFSLDDEEESKDTYPVRVYVPRGRVRRLTVVLRIVLVIPTYLVAAFAAAGLILVSPVLWVIVLISRQMPRVGFDAVASLLRYEARYYSYLGMVTDSYPAGVFGDGTFAYQDVVTAETTPPVPDAGPHVPRGVAESGHPVPSRSTPAGTWPALLLSRQSRRFVAVVLVVGACGTAANYAYEAHRIFAPPTQTSINALQVEQTDIGGTVIAESVQQLADAHAALTSTVETESGATTSCNGQLPCLTGYRRTVAGAFSAFLVKLGALAPLLAGPQLTQLSNVTRQIISVDQQLASAPDGSTYNALLPTMHNLLSQFDASYTALVNASLG